MPPNPWILLIFLPVLVANFQPVCWNQLIAYLSVKVICLSPTYELALQTGQVAEKMGKFCPEVKIGYAVRGEKGEKLWFKKVSFSA